MATRAAGAFVVLTAVLALPLPLAAQAVPERELSTDRPDKTESPHTVPLGRFQIEADLAAYTIDRERAGTGTTRSETISVGAVNLKYGIGADTDLQFIVEPFARRTESMAGTRLSRETGSFEELTFRVKHNLFGNDGGRAALALMPFVTVPTGGSRPVELGIIVPLAFDLGGGAGLGLMTEVDLVEEADGEGHAISFINSATIGLDLTDRLGAYTEIFTERTAEGGSDWIVTWDNGLTFALTDDLQLDAGVNIGLTDAADDLTVFAGISRRF